MPRNRIHSFIVHDDHPPSGNAAKIASAATKAAMRQMELEKTAELIIDGFLPTSKSVRKLTSPTSPGGYTRIPPPANRSIQNIIHPEQQESRNILRTLRNEQQKKENAFKQKVSNELQRGIEQRKAAVTAKWREANPLKNPKAPPIPIGGNNVELEVVNTNEFAGGFKRRKTRKSKKRVVRPLKKTLSLSRSTR